MLYPLVYLLVWCVWRCAYGRNGHHHSDGRPPDVCHQSIERREGNPRHDEAVRRTVPDDVWDVVLSWSIELCITCGSRGNRIEYSSDSFPSTSYFPASSSYLPTSSSYLLPSCTFFCSCYQARLDYSQTITLTNLSRFSSPFLLSFPSFLRRYVVLSIVTKVSKKKRFTRDSLVPKPLQQPP